MKFSPKQMLYLLSRVKRGLRPKFARPSLKALQETGGRFGTVDLSFREPFKISEHGAQGVATVVTRSREPMSWLDWSIYRSPASGKNVLHFTNITGPGPGAFGAANVRRILRQFKGYTQSQFSQITGHRVTGVRRWAPQTMRVNVPGEGMPHIVNPRIVRSPRPGYGLRGRVMPPQPASRPAVPEWNAPSIGEMKAGTARMPATWGHGHAQAVAARIRDWAIDTGQVGSEAHHRFTREAARQLRASNPRAFRYEDFFRAAMTGSERRPISTSRITGRGYLRRRRT